MTTTRKATAHEIILAILHRSGDWVPGHALASVEVPGMGWLSHNGPIRARELARMGTIERTLIDGRAHYRARVDEQAQPRLL